jgi:hypothetical protein
MANHYGHVLQVAFPAFLADRAIVRVIQHQVFDNGIAE